MMIVMKMYNISFLACIRFLSSAKEKNKSITPEFDTNGQ